MPLLTRSGLICQSHAAAETPGSKKVRRGTTAMEYLMMLSLIVVVAMIGVSYFGSMVAKVSQASSDAISKSTKKGG